MDILNEFKKWVVTDPKAQKYWEKVNNGKASYKDATDYSELVGDKFSKLMVEKYGISNDEIVQSLKKAYSESAYYSKNVQSIANQSANVGMKVLEPAIDEDRIKNLLEKMEEYAEEGKDASWMIGKDVVSNISRTAVTDTIQANSRIQSEAGLECYVERTGVGCCAWCSTVLGKYKLGEQPADFWKVHKGCTCIINYKVDKSKVQKIRFISGRKITD